MGLLPLWSVGALVLGCSWASAQSFTLTAGTAAGLPGDSVSVSVQLDGTAPIRGFSLGVTHPAALTLTSITQGSAVLATNSGAGADFIFVETNPVSGGPGGVFGVVVSLSAPIEDIPAGVGQQVAVLTYDISGSAVPGTNAPLNFTNSLVPAAGSPPVATVVSVAGVTHVPTQVAGSVLVETPPVENLLCSLTDPCDCSFSVSWSNPTSYDQIQVTLGGSVVATLAGSATSATVMLGAPGMDQICVIATRGGQASVPECCIVDCPVVTPVDPPSGLTCSVDSVTCNATLGWTNAGSYSSIAVTLDGNLVSTLAGTATGTTVALPLPSVVYTLCVVATDDCGIVLAPVCCTVECEVTVGVQFIRGDCNDDGNYNIADPVSLLGFLFPAGPAPVLPCSDACDCNDDGMLNIADAICLLSGLFGAVTVPPAPPHPGCGEDPTTGDALDCLSYTHCP
ncbi:MAG: hypothetical protein AB7O52_12710 [Planctomycetota bacterium]